MSNISVEETKIRAIKPHPNADRLEIATVFDYDTVVPKGEFSIGESVWFFPPDIMVPPGLSDKLGVTKYLKKGRVCAAKLRSVASYGFIAKDLTQEEADSCKKYELPEDYVPSHRQKQHRGCFQNPRFAKYGNIQHYRRYSFLLKPEDNIIITEKIHGMNTRLGLVDGEFCVGTHNVQRSLPESGLWGWITSWWRKPNPEDKTWARLLTPSIKELLQHISRDFNHADVVLYGEYYGRGIQKLNYGVPPSFIAFDILVRGNFLPFDSFERLCHRHDIPMVPVLYRGKYSHEIVQELTTGESTLDAATVREGVVVRTLARSVILKNISIDYLEQQ